mgnify:CR=1 FL=1
MLVLSLHDELLNTSCAMGLDLHVCNECMRNAQHMLRVVGVASQWDLKSGQCIHEVGNDAYEGITCVAADNNMFGVGD